MSLSKRRLPSVRRVLRWGSTVAFGLVCCAVAAIIVILTVLPRLTGGAALTVLTGSMTPEIAVGSVVLIRPVDPQQLEVGDVATYQVSPESRALVTHRVMEVQGSGDELQYIFKGDANRGADSTPVPPQAVRGEVWFHVPYLGSIRDAVHAEGMFALVAALLLAGYALAQLGGGLKDRRRGVDGAQKRAVAIGAPSLLAQLQTPTGEAPADLARRWGALLLHQDEDTVTLLIVPPDDGMAAALELLASQDPVRVEVWDADTVLTGSAQPVPQGQRIGDETEADHVAG